MRRFLSFRHNANNQVTELYGSFQCLPKNLTGLCQLVVPIPWALPLPAFWILDQRIRRIPLSNSYLIYSSMINRLLVNPISLQFFLVVVRVIVREAAIRKRKYKKLRKIEGRKEFHWPVNVMLDRYILKNNRLTKVRK